MSYEVGSIVEGTVVKITDYGAFVELKDGKRGLVHISEIADVYVRNIGDFLKEKDRVKVKILTISSSGKMDLSIKQAQTKKQPVPPSPTVSPKAKEVPPPSSFEEMMSKFLKESEERLLDLKRNTEAKRGGGRFRSYRRS